MSYLYLLHHLSVCNIPFKSTNANAVILTCSQSQNTKCSRSWWESYWVSRYLIRNYSPDKLKTWPNEISDHKRVVNWIHPRAETFHFKPQISTLWLSQGLTGFCYLAVVLTVCSLVSTAFIWALCSQYINLGSDSFSLPLFAGSCKLCCSRHPQLFLWISQQTHTMLILVDSGHPKSYSDHTDLRWTEWHTCC